MRHRLWPAHGIFAFHGDGFVEDFAALRFGHLVPGFHAGCIAKADVLALKAPNHCRNALFVGPHALPRQYRAVLVYDADPDLSRRVGAWPRERIVIGC